MAVSAPNRYLRSRLAYSFLTLSPWHAALTLFLAVLTICSFWDKIHTIPQEDLITILIIDICTAPAIVWCICAWKRWIPRNVIIPKQAHTGVPEHLGQCVMLKADSILNAEGCPALAYNANNYVGGRSEGKGLGPNLMAQAMAAYFNGVAEDYTYDFDQFMECYRDEKTILFSPDGQPLNKDDFDSPRPYDGSSVAQVGDKGKLLPIGSVLALHCIHAADDTEGRIPPYIFLLVSTEVEPGTAQVQSDITTLFSSLGCLWSIVDQVLGHKSCDICLPHLGKGTSALKDSGYSSLWAIVASYRAAYQNQITPPLHGLTLCIPPQHIRHLNLREILKIMTLALCSR